MQVIKRAIQIFLGLFAVGLILSLISTFTISETNNNRLILVVEPAIMILVIVGLEKIPTNRTNNNPIPPSKILTYLAVIVGLGLILGAIWLYFGLIVGGVS